jgi:hypothetical protein
MAHTPNDNEQTMLDALSHFTTAWDAVSAAWDAVDHTGLSFTIKYPFQMDFSELGELVREWERECRLNLSSEPIEAQKAISEAAFTAYVKLHGAEVAKADFPVEHAKYIIGAGERIEAPLQPVVAPEEFPLWTCYPIADIALIRKRLQTEDIDFTQDECPTTHVYINDINPYWVALDASGTYYAEVMRSTFAEKDFEDVVAQMGEELGEEIPSLSNVGMIVSEKQGMINNKIGQIRDMDALLTEFSQMDMHADNIDVIAELQYRVKEYLFGQSVLGKRNVS